MADVPTNLTVFNDSLKNVLIWDKMPSASSYNIYWATSSPIRVWQDENFSDLDDWDILTESGGASASIVDNELFINVPNPSGDAELEYRWVIPPGDFVMSVDLTGFTSAGGNNIFYARLETISSDENDAFGTSLLRITGSYTYMGHWVINGAAGNSQQTFKAVPLTGLRCERSGTDAKYYGYYSGAWNLIATKDFGSRIDNVDYVRLRAWSTGGNRTGTATFDNLTISPAANASTDTTTNNFYENAGLTAGTTYYYTITSVQEDYESLSCSEESGVPLAEQDQYAQLTNDDRSTIINLRVSTQEESDEDYDYYARANDATMQHYSIDQKKRFVVTFKNLNASDATDLKTLYDLNETLFFHRQRTGATLVPVKFKGNLNIHTPTNKSKMFIDSIYEGSMILEEVAA